eukprot:TRINITY_DN2288_c0_g1_i1.p1 TRINITY_DN2288_c0_g1~~TRINITY_DN2288_c0_g1_i1.p1  ORF type:complete len:225 (+),score=39.38 TRINITY_DN2288_c0_g1_i1:88-762(+)
MGSEGPNITSPYRRYYTPQEVSLHNHESDCWVSILGKVFDLTLLLTQYANTIEAAPIIQFAGKDVSHWFDPKTREVKTWVHNETGLSVPYTPQGRFIHVPPPFPSASFTTSTDLPWWEDKKYIIGNLSTRTRHIRIVNMLTHIEHKIEVCNEETIKEIQDRYLVYNKHAVSYVWKRLGKVLEMEKTLEENGIMDEQDKFIDLQLTDDYYLPAIHLYFKDDLTVA